MNDTIAPATGLLAPPEMSAASHAGAAGLLCVPPLGSFAAAVRAFLRAIDPTEPADGSRVWHRRPQGDRSAEQAYRLARREQATALRVRDADAERLRLPLAPRLTVSDDAWILEGWTAERSTAARLVVERDAWGDGTDLTAGTTRVTLGNLGPWSEQNPGFAIRLHPLPVPPDDPPPGWTRGWAALLGAMTLPVRRIPIDRGGLLGLLGAAGRARPERSILVRWDSGRPAVAEVQGRTVALHTRAEVDGPAGSAQVAAGSVLESLDDLLPWVEGAELLIGPAGSAGVWSIRLVGGIRLILAQAAWTRDGRLGALRVDASAPPIEAGRFLLNQVVASFRDRPVQTRREVVERTRGNAPAVLAALYRVAALGLILPEPETDRLRWRPAFGPDSVAPDDPEPAEVAAARAMTRTSSILVERDEPLPEGRGRRVEALILDRPARIEIAPDGWLRRGSCTCSHHEAGRLARGPCRHLLALQARAVDGAGLTPAPTDLAGWHAALGGPT